MSEQEHNSHECPGGVEADLVAEALCAPVDHIETLCEQGIIPDAHECMDEWLIPEPVFKSLVCLKLAHDALDLLHKATEMFRMAWTFDESDMLKDEGRHEIDLAESALDNLEHAEKELRSILKEYPVQSSISVASWPTDRATR